MSDQMKALKTENERLREALDAAAWNMQTLATDIRNPGQRALADRWIAAARKALAPPQMEGANG